MQEGTRTDTAYIAFAEEQLQRWALSTDVCDGDQWDLYCALAGLDPEVFAAGVEYERRVRNVA